MLLAIRAVAGLLLVWAPLELALRASAGLSALGVRGWPLGLFLVGHLIVTAFGFAAGRALLDQGAGAKRFAITAFALWAAIDVIYYASSIFPSSLPPGDAPVYLAIALLVDVVAIVALSRTQRMGQ